MAASTRPLLYDGAKGVLLSPLLPSVGREASDVSEWLNLLAPEGVARTHREYVNAGSQIIQTNTFNGNRFRLEGHGLGDRVREVNLRGGQLAREAAGDGVRVAGAMGPSGKWLALGAVTAEELREAFAAQASALAEGGVDLFHLETMTDLAEAQAAIEGVRGVSQLPIALTMSFDSGKPESGLRTMAGVSPAQLVRLGDELGLWGVGANCGRGLEGYQLLLTQLLEAGPQAPVIAKLNAGLPRVEGGELLYDGTPERMAEYAAWCAEHGVGIMGACCGSTPRHIEAMAKALASFG